MEPKQQPSSETLTVALDGEDLSLAVAFRAVKRVLIPRALAAADGNRAEAARLLGMTERALRYDINELGIQDAQAFLTQAPTSPRHPID